MSDWVVVLVKIAAMVLVILVGFAARRRAYLTAETTGVISRFAVDVALPALVLTQMLRTLTPAVLQQSWFIPILAGSVYVVGMLVGLAATPLFSRKSRAYTFIFLVGTPNWLYLPLPIVMALYGDDGVRALLLANAGIQILLWSLGVWILTGGRLARTALRNLLTNPGLIATALGVLLALFVPFSRELESADPASAWPLKLAASVVVQAMTMVGSLTIPLSLLMTGAVLAGLGSPDRCSPHALLGVVFSRLILVPAAVVGLVLLARQAGLAIPETPRMVAYLIACMPVAVTCVILTDRFRGDTPLAARSIFYSTAFSIITVPSLFLLIRLFGL